MDDFNDPIEGDEDALEVSTKPTTGLAKGSGMVKLNSKKDQEPGSHASTIPEKTEAREADSKLQTMQTHDEAMNQIEGNLSMNMKIHENQTTIGTVSQTSGAMRISTKSQEQGQPQLFQGDMTNINTYQTLQNNEEHEIMWANLEDGDMKEYVQKLKETMQEINEIITIYLKNGRDAAIEYLGKVEDRIYKFLDCKGPKTHHVYIRAINILLALGSQDKDGLIYKKACRLSKKIEKTLKEVPQCISGEENAGYWRLYLAGQGFYMDVDRESLLQAFLRVNQNEFKDGNDHLDLYYSLKGRIFESKQKFRDAKEAFQKAAALRSQKGQIYFLGVTFDNIARLYLSQEGKEMKHEKWKSHADDIYKKFAKLGAILEGKDELLLSDPIVQDFLNQLRVEKN